MKVVIGDKVVSVSVHERKAGNARVAFWWEGKMVYLTASAVRKKDVTRAEAQALVTEKFGHRERVLDVPTTNFRAAMESHLKMSHEGQVGKQPRIALERLGEVLGWPEVGKITKEAYRAAIPALQVGRGGKVNSPKTWRNVAGEHKHFAEWLLDEDLILKDFTRGVKLPGKRQFTVREEIFKEEWFAPIRDALPEPWKAVWEDAWFTGMDSKDLFDFRPALHLQAVGKGLKIWKVRSKSTIIIDQPLAASITPRWLKRREASGPSDPLHDLFREFRDSQAFGKRFRTEVRYATRKCGFPELQVKATRHTWLTRHLRRLVKREKGAPTIFEIRRWGGWAPGSKVPETVYAKLVSESENPD